MNGEVYALVAAADGTVYAGGDFTIAGNQSAQRVARWTPDGGGGGSWSALGFGFSTPVRSLAVAPSGEVYAGTGRPQSGGGSVRRWVPNGAGGGTWSTLRSLNGPVYALLLDPEGRLYAGGEFSTVTSTGTADRVAQWTPDGTGGGTWSALGGGGTWWCSGSCDTNYVTSLALGADGTLYVGGYLSGDWDGVLRWIPGGQGGGTWAPLSQNPPSSGRLSGTVKALAVDAQGRLYVGGSFHVGNGSLYNIARWAPNTTGGGLWAGLGGGTDSSVNALAFGLDGVLYVGGGFYEVNYYYPWVKVQASGIAAWTPGSGDEGVWSALGSGMSRNGSHADVAALAIGSGGGLYAGGDFLKANSLRAEYVAQYTPGGGGAPWQALGAGGPNGSFRSLSWGPDGALYAGGSFTSVGNASASLVARLSPQGPGPGVWSPLGSGLSGTICLQTPGAPTCYQESVTALTHAPDGTLYAGGLFVGASGVPGSNILARWVPDGAGGGSWFGHGSALLSSYFGSLSQISALVVGGDGALYVGGKFYLTGHPDPVQVARWNVTGAGTWDILRQSGSTITYALAFDPDGTLHAGEGLNLNGQGEGGRVTRWLPDGSGGGAWEAVGGDFNEPVAALTLGPDGAWYAGGAFDQAAGLTVRGVARWSLDGGGAWVPLGEGVRGAVSALAFGPEGGLYAGGRVSQAGGGPASMIARWLPAEGGGAWGSLGSGLAGDNPLYDGVSSIARGPDGLVYAGGRFSRAGGQVSISLARWQPTVVATDPAAGSHGLSISTPRPNPFGLETVVRFTMEREGPMRIAAYDVLGREVALLRDQFSAGGEHEVVWRPEGLPSGIYVLRLTSGAESRSIRVTRTR